MLYILKILTVDQHGKQSNITVLVVVETSDALSVGLRQDHLTQISLLQSLTYVTVHHWYKQKLEDTNSIII